MIAILICALLSFSSFSSGRGDITFSGQYFTKEKTNQRSINLSSSASIQDKFEIFNNDLNLSVIGKVEHKDKQASYIDLNELYYRVELPSNIDMNIGYQIFNWSKMEAFKLVNIVNSRYFEGNVESFDKKGELSLNFEKYSDFGIFKLFFFPKFTNSEFPSSSSRLADGVDPKAYKSVSGSNISSDEYIAQFGMSFEKQFGDLDLHLFALKHIDRTRPIIGYKDFIKVGTQLIPNQKLTVYYFDVLDIGLSSTYFLRDHTIKFELLGSYFDVDDIEILSTGGVEQVKDYKTATLGYEYTHLWEQSKLSSTFYLEYQRVFGVSSNKSQSLSVFQDDIFFAHRLNFNDKYSKELTLSLFYDLNRDQEWIVNLNYSQRITDFWKGSIGYRAYGFSEDDRLGLASLDGDNEMFLTLTRSF